MQSSKRSITNITNPPTALITCIVRSDISVIFLWYFCPKSDTFSCKLCKKALYLQYEKQHVRPLRPFPPRRICVLGLSTETMELQPHLCLSGEMAVSQQWDVRVSAVRRSCLISETPVSRPWDTPSPACLHSFQAGCLWLADKYLVSSRQILLKYPFNYIEISLEISHKYHTNITET